MITVQEENYETKLTDSIPIRFSRPGGIHSLEGVDLLTHVVSHADSNHFGARHIFFLLAV